MSTELVALDDVERALIHMEAIDIVPPEDISADIVRRILESDTLEEAARDFTADPADSIEGAEVVVTGVAWMKSAFDEGAPVYALMRVHGPTDKRERVVSIGGRSVLAMLLWAQRHEAMPFNGTFRKRPSRSDPSRSYWTFNLAPATVRASK